MKKFLALLGVIVLGFSVQAKSIYTEEYSSIQKYLNVQQVGTFEKVFGTKIAKIENYEVQIEILEEDNKEKNEKKIAELKTEIQKLKTENVNELFKLKKSFVKNPERFNPATVYSFSEKKDLGSKEIFATSKTNFIKQC